MAPHLTALVQNVAIIYGMIYNVRYAYIYVRHARAPPHVPGFLVSQEGDDT